MKKEEYHGGTFAGNASRKLLKNVDRLEALQPPQIVIKYVNAFKSFNHAVAAFYGSKLDDDYQQKISVFVADYLKLKITVTPKVHAVFFHVSEFCDITGRGLGPWNEQAGESVHCDLKKTGNFLK